MNNHSSPTIEEFEALKKKCRLLQLQLKETRVSRNKLRTDYEAHLHKAIDGIPVYDQDCMDRPPLFSTNEIAKAYGFNDKKLRALLRSEGILRVERRASYPVNPQQMKNLVAYRRFHLSTGGKRLCLYWTMHGVTFVSTFAEAHGLKSSKPLPF